MGSLGWLDQPGPWGCSPTAVPVCSGGQRVPAIPLWVLSQHVCRDEALCGLLTGDWARPPLSPPAPTGFADGLLSVDARPARRDRDPTGRLSSGDWRRLSKARRSSGTLYGAYHTDLHARAGQPAWPSPSGDHRHRPPDVHPVSDGPWPLSADVTRRHPTHCQLEPAGVAHV